MADAAVFAGFLDDSGDTGVDHGGWAAGLRHQNISN